VIRSRNRSHRSILALLAPILFCSCFSQTVPVDLSRATILPVVATDREAVPNAQPLSLVRPRDLRKDPALSTVLEASVFPTRRTFVPENDAAVWAGNGFVDGLENAGYKVEHASSVGAAGTGGDYCRSNQTVIGSILGNQHRRGMYNGNCCRRAGNQSRTGLVQ